MDTNVVIDFLAGREPFATDAARLFNLAVEGKVKIYISAVSYNNIYYVLRQSAPGTVVIKLLEGLADITQITDVTGAVIRQSLGSDFKDYEDAVQYHCALAIPGVDFIVTRNTKDFKKSALPVMSPVEALSSLV